MSISDGVQTWPLPVSSTSEHAAPWAAAARRGDRPRTVLEQVLQLQVVGPQPRIHQIAVERVVARQIHFRFRIEHVADTGVDFHVGQERAESAGTGYGTRTPARSEEHTSELQSLMRISYAVF